MGKMDDLFAMRWVLPEHGQALSDYYFEKTLVEKPELEEDEKAEINRILQESLQLDYAITIIWWQQFREELGNTCSMWGIVKWIDQQGRRIKLMNDEEIQWIQMDQIVDIRT
ncbi:YolD-like family protein [Brevibacillus ruminantium]|uniref:YolD-like family protein n=1 Tax=Brevibacillus ruminantium TaxID=2950604 RepID=A0ABY4WH24_9BACL|nr:YolD-like family protein [Brevibacillus ruminantium]USG65140.1 YolD-like family protein [Brevibacillus ruminantium]